MRGLTIGSRIAHLYRIGEDIDEAPGAFARTFLATNGDGKERAFKVFRWEHFELPEERCFGYYRTLANEASLLTELKGHPNVVELYDMGYIWPTGDDQQAFEVLSFGMNAEGFCNAVEMAFGKRYLPYLVLQRMRSKYSLFRLVRRKQHRVRLPTEDIIGMALQLAAALVGIHARNILYWDPKPEHVYWTGNRVVLIDWNVSRRIEHFEEQDKGQDIQLIAQRVLYPVLTGGMNYATGAMIEATPGSSPIPTARNQVDYGGEERWLDQAVRRWLDPALLGQYRSAEEFLRDVQACAVHYGWELQGIDRPTAKAIRSRADIRDGLEKIAQAQALLEEAANHFAQASIDFLPEDYQEAKRLSRLVRGLLSAHWPLP